jgi:hypothetical protein
MLERREMADPSIATSGTTLRGVFDLGFRIRRWRQRMVQSLSAIGGSLGFGFLMESKYLARGQFYFRHKRASTCSLPSYAWAGRPLRRGFRLLLSTVLLSPFLRPITTHAREVRSTV